MFVSCRHRVDSLLVALSAFPVVPLLDQAGVEVHIGSQEVLTESPRLTT